jgi:molybdopterin/thiamine biosynthesis adenylyltransferase
MHVDENRHSRNIIAFGYSPELTEEYSKKIAELGNGNPEDGSRIRQTLREELFNKTQELGRERQAKLQQARVALVGTDILAQMVATCLVGIGVGNIYLIDNSQRTTHSKDFLFHPQLTCTEKVKHMEVALKELNPRANIYSTYAYFDEGHIFQHNPQLIIDATNDPVKKKKVVEYVKNYSIPVISLSSTPNLAMVCSYWPANGRIRIHDESPDLEALLHNESKMERQGVAASGIAAGIGTDEFRKFVFKYGNSDENLASNTRFIYNQLSTTKKGLTSDLKPGIGLYRNKRALIAGAGALGNFVALELALLGFGAVDIVDKDTIEMSNYVRQPLLRSRARLLDNRFDGIGVPHEGKRKVEEVAKRLSEIDSTIAVSPLFAKFGELDDKLLLYELRKINTEKYGRTESIAHYREQFELDARDKRNKVELITINRLSQANYDVIFGCFDNKYARLWLNNFAVHHKVPYIDGGTGPRGGRVSVYIPGNTRCVDCQLKLKYASPGIHSCSDHPDGSTVVPNIIIASEMVASAQLIFASQPVNGIFYYSSSEKDRIYVKPFRESQNEHRC